MTSNLEVVWIAADWGTTNLRAWALGPDNRVLEQRSSKNGMGTLVPDQFETVLLELIEDWLVSGRRTPVVVCGMAGARQGWSEAPYKEVPCTPPGLADAKVVAVSDPRLDVRILPGLKQEAPADVMRGEETQIAGFLANRPGFSGLVCLPGTHTKWIVLEEGAITRFRSFMTGETYALFRKHSILRHGLAEGAFDDGAFQTAVREITLNPEQLTGALFGIRASGLIAELTPEAASGRLSGLLIGAELAAMAPDLDQRTIALLGNADAGEAYRIALEVLGYKSEVLDAAMLTVQGLTYAYATGWKET